LLANHVRAIAGRAVTSRVAILVALLALAVGAVVWSGGKVARTSAAGMVCNGSALLCDRPFNEVVFPATHNSMSAADEGWTFPYQDHGIEAQLNYGIRMFLIDTHYWRTNGDAEPWVSKLPAEPQARARAEMARAGDPRPGVFLCHNYCALGHVRLSDALSKMRTFMDSHPHDVVGIFFQDDVSNSDTQKAFQRSGLLDYVYTHYEGAPWPTLREMILRHKRLVVMAEKGGPPPGWYGRGWDLTSDTRFDVQRPGDFNCAVNRGKATNDLFLLNNWIAKTVPTEADAAEVNSYGFLLQRARTCMAERGHLPNFIAVNFYDKGDLLRVVDTMNGLGGH
jgi:hypothetical protein